MSRAGANIFFCAFQKKNFDTGATRVPLTWPASPGAFPGEPEGIMGRQGGGYTSQHSGPLPVKCRLWSVGPDFGEVPGRCRSIPAVASLNHQVRAAAVTYLCQPGYDAWA